MKFTSGDILTVGHDIVVASINSKLLLLPRQDEDSQISILVLEEP